jgi:hypothetical protein
MSNTDSNKNTNHPYYPFLKWGFLHTPFMIYIKSYNTLSDEDFMKLFGLQDYHKASPPLSSLGSHVVFANDAEWTHIADDCRYTLWRNPKTAETVEKLGKQYDVFRNSIADIDNSFEFEYYQDKKLVRKFVFDHDVFKNTEFVTVDTGTKLVGEPTTLDDLKSASEKMFPSIIQSLGITRVIDPLQNRFYSKLQEN